MARGTRLPRDSTSRRGATGVAATAVTGTAAAANDVAYFAGLRNRSVKRSE